MSLFPFRRLLVAPLGAALALTVLVSVPGTASAAAPAAADPSQVTVTGLKVNGRTNPLGIPGGAPSFGWHGESAARGVVQTAYQIQVATSEAKLSNPDIWNSGRRTSNRQVDVLYQGAVGLTSQTRYFWRVRTWDGQDNISDWSEVAWFETGMLSAADWGGAEWIGAATHVEADRWHDYTADFTFSLDDGGFGVFLGARNVDYGYMWQISVADGTPRFRPHVKIGGQYALRANKDISSVISVADLMHGVHTLSVTVDLTTVTTRIDGKVIENRVAYASSFNPINGFVGVRTGLGEDATIHRVKVTADSGGDTLLSTDFSDNNPFGVGEINSAGLELEGPLEGVWQPNDQAMPLLRTEFASSKTVTRARIYATAQGIYQMSLNGQPVGDQHLAPGWTDYRKRIQHQTYDATDLVRAGTNAWGVELGRGWYAGRVAHLDPGQYGQHVSFLARLRLDYSDGTTQWVDTNDSTWVTRPGPYTATDNIDGESYDARLEQPGFDQPGLDDSGWYAAVGSSGDTTKVVVQPDEPVRTTLTIPAQRRTNPAPGKYVYDLKQNIVGVARMVLHGKAGTTATIRYGEALNPDGTLYTANLRSARVIDTYTFDADGTATYEAAFTQHGFQYVEISGTDTPPAVGDVTGVVWGSDLAATGSLETSNPMLNQLLSNISWGQRDNFLSVPTDTPARDERMGWTGDINVFAPTASYLRDTRAFFGKWMRDLADTQYPLGEFRAVAPVPPDMDFDMLGGVGWSDAAITVPYSTWRAFGDASVVRQFYPAMRLYLTLVRQQWNRSPGARRAYGDWLNLDDPTPEAVLGTAYLAEDARMMSEMAAAIGQTADATEFSQLSADTRSYFASNLVSADGTVSGNSQTGYAMALGMGLVPDGLEAKVGAKFVAKIAASGNHLTTGFLGTPWLLPALSAIGRDTDAWQLLMRTDYPSWGYEVANGATTMWERWNTIMPDGSFGDVSMNSFNHYAYGAVGDWMYRNIGGIAPDEPGYRKIRVAPRPGGGVTHAAGSYDSVYGTIHTDWTVNGDDMTLEVDVPVNTTAEVVLPRKVITRVRESGLPLSQAEGVSGWGFDDGFVSVTVSSGSYRFTYNAANARLGTPVNQLEELRGFLVNLVADGSLSPTDRSALDASLVGAREHLGEAVQAELAGRASTGEVQSSTRAVRDLRLWLAASSVQAEVRADLDARLASLEKSLSDVVSSDLDVVARVMVPDGRPGALVNATVDIDNTSLADATAVTGWVRVGGWAPVRFGPMTVAKRSMVHVPVAVRIPDDAPPGRYGAEAAVTLTLGGATYDLTDVRPEMVRVDSGLQIGNITMTQPTGDLVERATMFVPVTNSGPVTLLVRAEVTNALPAGWKVAASSNVSVPAGGSATTAISLVVPTDRVGGEQVPVTVAVTRAGATMATKSVTFSMNLAAPPVTPYDHVDFGNTASEQAHAVKGSTYSGTDTYAGYTRRYAHIAHPGSWFSAELKVPTSRPFVLRAREVFGGPGEKRYQVIVDNILVKTMTNKRTEAGPGSNVYDLLVDKPFTLDPGYDGKVVVRYYFPEGSPGDPSLADLWVLPADDQDAPLPWATLTGGTPGNNGWYRSAPRVELQAVDNRQPAPNLKVKDITPGAPGTWQDYTEPVVVSGDGKHFMSYQAFDGAGLHSTEKAFSVPLDATAPSTTLVLDKTATQATVRLTATDVTSGIAETVYRVDGGAWLVLGPSPILVQGSGIHTVEFYSTDKAGNPEKLRRLTLALDS